MWPIQSPEQKFANKGSKTILVCLKFTVFFECTQFHKPSSSNSLIFVRSAYSHLANFLYCAE
jgi:hypothetical protein